MQPARALAAVLEPVVGQVYFSPECHANYVALGFAPSRGDAKGVALPDGPAYFTSRGSVMGQVSGVVVAAAFAVFNPAAVVASVSHGWSLTDAATVCQARDDGAIAQLTRILGPAPDGVVRAAEMLRPVVDTLRPEGRPLYWGLPMRSYSRTRAWSDEQFEAAHQRLRSRGLVDEIAFTEAGSVLREDVEVHTDQQLAGALRAFGDTLDELLQILKPWGEAVRAAHGYPASGPHDLAKLTGGAEPVRT